MSVIYTLWLRELKRHLRSRSRIVGSLGRPMLFLIVLGFGLGPVFARAGAGNYFQFLVPGVICMEILFTAVFSGVQVIWDRQFGFLKITLVAPVSRFEIMLGKTFGGATVAAIQGFIIFLISLIVGFRIQNLALLPLALVFIFLIAILFTALGITIASLLEDAQGFHLIMNFLVMPLFFLSGALFPLSEIPKILLIIVSINPLSYGVDGLRGTLINDAYFGLTVDLLVLSVVTGLFLLIGSYLFSKIQI
ncbi:ABC transporter permease [Patescibacteria group bacterium]|nr:ABC transporter permease [Patescibacteria group bacterium]